MSESTSDESMPSAGPVEARIHDKLQHEFEPQHLQVENESHMHNVPPGSESHFKVVLVSDALTNVRKVARHQRVYGILAEELAGPVHALALHLYTAEEWASQQTAPASPACMGGGARDL